MYRAEKKPRDACVSSSSVAITSTSDVGSYWPFVCRWAILAIFRHRQRVRVCSLWSTSRAFSELHRNVPYADECTAWCSATRKLGANSNAIGFCCISCQMQSRHCVKTGDTSRRGRCSVPRRSSNLWPNASHSLCNRAHSPAIVRECGSSMIWASVDSCAVRSQPSEQCTSADSPRVPIMWAMDAAPFRSCRMWYSHSLRLIAETNGAAVVDEGSFSHAKTASVMLHAATTASIDARITWMFSTCRKQPTHRSP
mmetsp:Transcript_33608/g.88283  ORF Transcript_33608/g.88283 Transcript_33608/m.88283 type:complete len:254 (-) Transcript_33608:802-1563(-)